MSSNVEDSSFRILSLDGGGILGTYSAAVLSYIEQAANVQIARYFDLITGTSTGGLIALALAMDTPATKVLEIYKEKGSQIFPYAGLHRRLFRRIQHLLKPKWSLVRLEEVVHEIVGDGELKDAKRYLVIPSFECTYGKAHLFRTPHHPSFKPDEKRKLESVGLATAAAPTFFPAFTSKNSKRTYLDGGVWANHPILVGTLEAIRWLGKMPQQIKLLSIGVTTEPFYATQRGRKFGGILTWNVGLIALLMQAQATGSQLLTEDLLGDRLITINTFVEPGRFRIDDASMVDELAAIGKTAGEKNLDRVVREFITSPAPPPKFF
jgi:uncharacterized protein